MKKLASLVLAGCLVASLAGCGGNSGTGGGSGNKDSASGSDAAKGDMVKVSLTGYSDFVEGIEIHDIPDANRDITILWSGGWEYHQVGHSPETPDPNYTAKLAWEETMGGTATVKVVGESSQTSYLASAIASGTAPDMIANFFPQWPIAGFTQDLSDPEMEKYLQWDDTSVWDHNVSKKWEWNGERTGIKNKCAHDAWLIAYNKTKFEEAGEKTPMDYYKEGKWTWTQFVKTAKNMTNAAKDEYGYIGLYLQPKGEYRLDSSGHFYIDFNSNLMRKNTEIFNLFQATDHPGRLGNKNYDFRTLFAGGTDAMAVLGEAEYYNLLDTAKKNGGDEFGCAPMFSWDILGETDPYLYDATWCYSICSASDNKIGAAVYTYLEAAIMCNIDNKANKREKNGLTADEIKALEDVDKLLDNQKIDLETRNYELTGLFDLHTALISKQTLSLQGMIDNQEPTVQAEIDKINKQIDVYSKD